MADYIERTEALILAMNAGARAIENTKRYHGASYTRDAFSADSKTIPHLEAARVLRDASDAPAASVFRRGTSRKKNLLRSGAGGASSS